MVGPCTLAPAAAVGFELCSMQLLLQQGTRTLCTHLRMSHVRCTPKLRIVQDHRLLDPEMASDHLLQVQGVLPLLTWLGLLLLMMCAGLAMLHCSVCADCSFVMVENTMLCRIQHV